MSYGLQVLYILGNTGQGVALIDQPGQVLLGVLGEGAASNASQPLVPISAPVGNVYIDPSNVTGHASANGPGTIDAPFRYFWQLANAWGTIDGLYTTTTNVIGLSSHTDDTDPIVWRPLCAQGASCSVQAVEGTVLATVTLSGVIPNSTTVGSNNPLIVNAGPDATPGVLLINATAGKASRAWVYAIFGDGPAVQVSQPLEPAGALPLDVYSLAPVNTWADGDTVHVVQPIQLNIVDLDVRMLLFGTEGNAAFTVYNCTVWDPLGIGADTFYCGKNVVCVEVGVQPYLAMCGNGGFAKSFTNCAVQGGVSGSGDANAGVLYSSSQIPADPAFYGGYLTIPSGGFGSFGFYSRPTFDGNCILGGENQVVFYNGAFFGTVYLDTEMVVWNGNIQLADIEYGGPYVYGSLSSGCDMLGTSAFRLAPDVTFTDAFLAPGFVSGFMLNGSTTASAHTGASPDVLYSDRTITPAALDAAVTGEGGFGGTAFILGGASVSNVLT